MNRKVSVSVIMLVSVISMLGLLSGVTFYLYRQENARSVMLGEQLDIANKNYQMTEAKLSESERMVTMLEGSLKDARGQIKSLEITVKDEISAKEQAMARVSELEADLRQTQQARIELEKRLSLVQSEVDKAATQIKSLGARKAELEQRLQDIQAMSAQATDAAGGVALGNIVVTQDQKPGDPIQAAALSVQETGASAQPAHTITDGKVLIVNREYNFAVINKGSKDGVSVGTDFAIYHNNKFIGDIRVEQLHDAMSAAGFLTPELRDKIREGDTVVKK
jgi:flagellar biosynthesis chaperone FliJ